MITKLILLFQKWRYGKPLAPTLIWAKRPPLLRAFLRLVGAFEKGILPKGLRYQVMLRVSEIDECAFCIDLNRARAPTEIDEKTKKALFYAEQMLSGKGDISPLKGDFTEEEIVELVALIATQHLSTSFNKAFGVKPHGFCRADS